MKYVIDRFEGNFAVCEDENGNMVNINRDSIPPISQEGDVLIQLEDNYVIDEKETSKRKNRIKDLAKELWID